MSSPDQPLPPWNGIAPVAVLDRVRRLNRRYLNPIIRRIAGRLPGPLIVLRHRGRASGQAYLTPLIAEKTHDGFVIPLTYGERADWVKNVMVAGEAGIRHRGLVQTVVNPVILDDRSALPMLSPFLRLPAGLFGIKRFMSVRTARGAKLGLASAHAAGSARVS